jgi:hypothetical protein
MPESSLFFVPGHLAIGFKRTKSMNYLDTGLAL